MNQIYTGCRKRNHHFAPHVTIWSAWLWVTTSPLKDGLFEGFSCIFQTKKGWVNPNWATFPCQCLFIPQLTKVFLAKFWNSIILSIIFPIPFYALAKARMYKRTLIPFNSTFLLPMGWVERGMECIKATKIKTRFCTWLATPSCNECPIIRFWFTIIMFTGSHELAPTFQCR